MASTKWKPFDEINNIISNRNFIFWGASNWISMTGDYLLKKADYIVDTNPNNHGTIFEDFKVRKPNFQDIKKHKYFIIITTGNYDTLCADLIREGFEMGIDFCVSPFLEERAKKDALLNLEKKILIASPEHSFLTNSGGGLYELSLLNGDAKKVYTGKCRTVVKFDEKFAVIDMLSGLIILDKNYNVLEKITLPENTEPHGLYYCDQSKLFFLGCPGNDCVYSMSVEGDIKDCFNITDKYQNRRADYHHINDLMVKDNSLFVSMFSISGNWNHQVYDGGVVEFDIETKQKIGSVWRDLWMPHSITKYNNTLCLLDSMTGRLISADHTININLPGFVRGLDFVDNFAIIALSSHRYPEKATQLPFPVMMNAGVAVVDLKNNMFKLFDLKQTNTIHSVVCI